MAGEQQFLCDGSNTRTDTYGGNIENRFRVLGEIVEAVVGVLGSERIGVRLSPASTFNSIRDSDRGAHMAYVIERLNAYNLAYLHIVEPRIDGSRDKDPEALTEADAALSTATWRRLWRGTLIGAGGYTRRGAERALREGTVDLVAYGRYFIPNPDLPERLAAAFAAEGVEGGGEEEEGWTEADKAVLTPYDRSTFYGGDARGYTDFPTLAVEGEQQQQRGGNGNENGKVERLN